jgi:hypothetical protein
MSLLQMLILKPSLQPLLPRAVAVLTLVNGGDILRKGKATGKIIKKDAQRWSALPIVIKLLFDV